MNYRQQNAQSTGMNPLDAGAQGQMNSDPAPASYGQIGMAASNLMVGHHGIAVRQAIDAAPAPTAHGEIHARLAAIRDRLVSNSLAVMDLGARAYGGGSPQATDKGAPGARPQPSGSLAAISGLLEEIENTVSAQREAINFVDRLA